MTTRRLAVVTAGISQPSSTRLLADRLTAATVDALAARGIEAEVSVFEVRELARDLVDHLLTGFPSPRLRAAIDALTGRRRHHRRVAHLQRVVQRPVQDLLRRARDGRPARHARRARARRVARSDTRWRSITRCGRCSRTSVRRPCPPVSSRPPTTGATRMPRRSSRDASSGRVSSSPRPSPYMPDRRSPTRSATRCPSHACWPARRARAGASAVAPPSPPGHGRQGLGRVWSSGW